MHNTISKLVDYHCHLDLYPNYQEMFGEPSSEDVITLAVTTTPKAWAKNKELAQHSRNVRVALGLHPQLVAERADEITLFENLLNEARFVGEVGLDAGPRFYHSYDLQKQIFIRILKACAVLGNRILSVHSVRATSEVLNLIEEHLPSDRGRVVLHWFNGSKSEADRAVKFGCYFSVNIEMLKKETRREVIYRLPLERILTESDGPFTTTSNHPSVPKDVTIVVSKLADLFSKRKIGMQDQIAANVEALEYGPGI